MGRRATGRAAIGDETARRGGASAELAGMDKHLPGYDADRIARIGNELAASVDAAMLGNGSWADIPAILGRAFPGSWTALQNINLSDPRLDFYASFNIDPYFVRTYVEHFAFINPWDNLHWTSVRSGTVAISEEVAPARLIKRTEFYNDWLVPQGAEAATGLKIDGDHDENIRLYLHFPMSQAEAYSRSSAAVLARMRGNLLRSIEIGRLLRRDVEGALSAAALVERASCAALVVDARRRLHDANQKAVDLLAAGSTITGTLGRLHLVDRKADDKLEELLSVLTRGDPVDGSRLTYSTGDAVWQVILAALPPLPAAAGALGLIPARRLVLAVVNEVTSDPSGPVDQSLLRLAFGLTPAEARLAARLGLGDSLRAVAEREGVTFETARTRLKSVFAKTQTKRQAELALLVARLTR